MKTGNTCGVGGGRNPPPEASMEPGHEDREYEIFQLASGRV